MGEKGQVTLRWTGPRVRAGQRPPAIGNAGGFLMRKGVLSRIDPPASSIERHPMLAILLLIAAPQRPLAGPSAVPLGDGPNLYADAARGDDAKGDGTEAKPWKSLAHAAGKLRPGDTLVLRGG